MSRVRRLWAWAWRRRSLGAFLFVVLAGAWGFNVLQTQSDQLERVVADQTVTVGAQCSLYRLIFRGDTPERRAAMSTDELAEYDRSLAVIHRDADNLGCNQEE